MTMIAKRSYEHDHDDGCWLTVAYICMTVVYQRQVADNNKLSFNSSIFYSALTQRLLSFYSALTPLYSAYSVLLIFTQRGSTVTQRLFSVYKALLSTN